MRILILGGTGAMGVALQQILAERGDEVYVTSRREISSAKGNVHYLRGNAMDENFLDEILREGSYDAVVDFMCYDTWEFEPRVEKLLRSTGQYIFTSSGRVYANAEIPITEESPRLLDVSKDAEYLTTDEYALAKARCENLLFHSERKNWTVIRPYITYNVERLQLGTLEIHDWLHRALIGHKVLLPKDVAGCQTTMTYSGDVARLITALLGNADAEGEVFNLTCGEHKTWAEIWAIYKKALYTFADIEADIFSPETSEELCRIRGNLYQTKYDRLFCRVFDSSKVKALCGESIRFRSIEDGVSECIECFLKNPVWRAVPNARLEAYEDGAMGERIDLRRFTGGYEKAKYLGWRFAPGLLDALK